MRHTPLVNDDLSDLPLFNGPHIPRVRFERALETLDLRSAVVDAPPEWLDAVAEMAAALEERGTLARVDLDRLLRCRRKGWPDALERTWQKLVGLRLDSHGVPGKMGTELAAEFLLRGGEPDRAHASLRRYLEYHPRDAQAWEALTRFERIPAAVRCAFHGGGLLLDVVGDLVDAVEEDEHAPAGAWLLSYAWFSGGIDMDEVARALAAEDLLGRPPLPVPGDARAFAWYLVDAGGRPYGQDSVGVVEARERLQRISRVAFARYLKRVQGGRI
jgi:hypothetical protein